MSKKPCHLCDTDNPPYRRGSSKIHGVRVSFGMLDVTCPISKTEYDDLIIALCAELKAMRSETSGADQ